MHLTRESLVFEEAWENRHRLVTCSSGRVRTLVSSTSMRFFSITFAYIFTSLSEFSHITLSEPVFIINRMNVSVMDQTNR